MSEMMNNMINDVEEMVSSPFPMRKEGAAIIILNKRLEALESEVSAISESVREMRDFLALQGMEWRSYE